MGRNVKLWSDNIKLLGWRAWCNLLKIDVEGLTDEQISDIVFDDVEDDGKNAEFALVFGNYQLQEERVRRAVELYKNGRVKKIVFMGGSGGNSNDGNFRSEAEYMRRQALKLGVSLEDIMTDAKSNSTKQNCRNVAHMLDKVNCGFGDSNRFILVSNDFHLKRCKILCEKYFPSGTLFTLVPCKSGFTDEENWYQSKMGWRTGRGIVTLEASQILNAVRKDKNNDMVKTK